MAKAINKTPPSISSDFEPNRFKTNPPANPKNELAKVIRPIANTLNNNGLFVKDKVMPAEKASMLVAIPISNNVFKSTHNSLFSSFLNAS